MNCECTLYLSFRCLSGKQWKREKVCHHLSSLVYSATWENMRVSCIVGAITAIIIFSSFRNHNNLDWHAYRQTQASKTRLATLDCISAVTLSLWRMFSQLKLKKGPDRPCSLQASKLKLLVLYRTPYIVFFKVYTLSQKYRRKEWVIIARGLFVLWEHKLTPTLMFISSDNRSFTLSFGLFLGNWHTDGESFHVRLGPVYLRAIWMLNPNKE